ncbi:hypothetical protein L7F22_007496 [Adiantum nelumboides]|nr:hypothetical protein [Adiantum nelumboides]
MSATSILGREEEVFCWPLSLSLFAHQKGQYVPFSRLCLWHKEGDGRGEALLMKQRMDREAGSCDEEWVGARGGGGCRAGRGRHKRSKLSQRSSRLLRSRGDWWQYHGGAAGRGVCEEGTCTPNLPARRVCVFSTAGWRQRGWDGIECVAQGEDDS